MRRMANVHIEFIGVEEIRVGVEQMQNRWEYFVHNTHPGLIRLDGDTATGRAYIVDFGKLQDGGSQLRYFLYHDRYRRTPDGWRFGERVH